MGEGSSLGGSRLLVVATDATAHRQRGEQDDEDEKSGHPVPSVSPEHIN